MHELSADRAPAAPGGEPAELKVLLLPNFRVKNIEQDDPTILPANKMTDPRKYWFFGHVPGVKVEVIDNYAPRLFASVAKRLKMEIFQAFRAFVRQNEYDVIISHSFNSGFVFALLRSLSGRSRPPHFVVDVGSLNGGKENPLQFSVIRLALRSVSGIIYHSKVNDPFYDRNFRRTRRRFVYFGLDPSLYAPDPKAGTKAEYALSIGDPLSRDYETLVSAWKYIRVPLKIVGSTAVDTKGASNIELIPRVDALTLTNMIQEAKYVILPILDKKYSVGQTTLLQCMALRKSVIVPDVPGIRDYCLPEVNCLVYRARNPEDLAKKFNLLVAHPDLAEQLAASARETVVSSFNEKRMAEEIMDFVRSAVDRSGRGVA